MDKFYYNERLDRLEAKLDTIINNLYQYGNQTLEMKLAAISKKYEELRKQEKAIKEWS